MKEAFEKIKERLEENQEIDMYMDGRPPKQVISYDRAIEIVNQVAEECKDNEILSLVRMNADFQKAKLEELRKIQKDMQNDGWIPCSERLPKGKETHKVLVTDKDGIMAVCYFLEVTKVFKVCWDGEEFYEVIAWQPLPEPYKEEA